MWFQHELHHVETTYGMHVGETALHTNRLPCFVMDNGYDSSLTFHRRTWVQQCEFLIYRTTLSLTSVPEIVLWGRWRVSRRPVMHILHFNNATLCKRWLICSQNVTKERTKFPRCLVVDLKGRMPAPTPPLVSLKHYTLSVYLFWVVMQQCKSLYDGAIYQLQFHAFDVDL